MKTNPRATQLAAEFDMPAPCGTLEVSSMLKPPVGAPPTGETKTKRKEKEGGNKEGRRIKDKKKKSCVRDDLNARQQYMSRKQLGNLYLPTREHRHFAFVFFFFYYSRLVIISCTAPRVWNAHSVCLSLSLALELLLAPFICADARSNCDGIMRHRFQQGHIQTGERFTVALANIAKLEAAAVAERDAHVPMASR